MERFRELYNGEDMERFVVEAYAASFHVLNLDGSSRTASRANRQNLLNDRDTFIRAEAFIKAKAPERRMVYRRLVPSGNVVTLEASIVDQSRPGWELSWCGITPSTARAASSRTTVTSTVGTGRASANCSASPCRDTSGWADRRPRSVKGCAGSWPGHGRGSRCPELYTSSELQIVTNRPALLGAQGLPDSKLFVTKVSLRQEPQEIESLVPVGQGQ